MKSYIIFSSSKWLYIIGLLAVFFSPFIGLLLGIYFWSNSQMAKEGKTITILALVWLIILLYLNLTYAG